MDEEEMEWIADPRARQFIGTTSEKAVKLADEALDYIRFVGWEQPKSVSLLGDSEEAPILFHWKSEHGEAGLQIQPDGSAEFGCRLATEPTDPTPVNLENLVERYRALERISVFIRTGRLINDPL